MNIEKSDVPSIAKGYKQTDIGILPPLTEQSAIPSLNGCSVF